MALQQLWPITWPDTVDVGAIDTDLREWAELAAANALRFLTLYRVGGTPISVRPCGTTCRSPHYFQLGAEHGAGFHPYLADNGMYANCWCSSGCRCDEPEGFRLQGPVGAIEYIRIDGTLVPPEDYYLVGGDTVVRKTGGWPGCRARTEVRYTQGYPVDMQGQWVGGILAEEFLKAKQLDPKCRLPKSITNLTRAGITMTFSIGQWPDMLTGIKEIDQYLVQWNPNGKRQAPGILSPDLDTPTVVSW